MPLSFLWCNAVPMDEWRNTRKNWEGGRLMLERRMKLVVFG